MPAPAPSWNTCRVFASWNGMGGGLRPGKYKVTIPVRVTNVTDDVIIPAGLFAQGDLNVTPGLPSLDIEVPSNNDSDNSPNGWQPIIEVTFPDAPAEKYVIDTPVDGEVNLRTVVLAASLPVLQAVLIRGVPGGLAELDADGDVVDAAGTKVSAGGVTEEDIAPLIAGKADTSSLSLVATTGAYDDLTGRPTIPTVPATLAPTDGSVTAAKMASGLVAMTASERAKLTSLPSDAQSAAQVDARLATVIGAAPAALDTLDELAAALADDASFAASVTTSLAAKADAATMTAALAGKASTASATTSATGLVELATTTEAQTGTDTARAVTPAGLKAVADTKADATATTAALATKAPTASPTFTGTVTVPDDAFTTAKVANLPPIYSETPLAAGATLPNFAGLIFRLAE